VVLASTYEYRQPSETKRREAIEKAAGGTVTLDMTSRFLGLVVVPGQHIVKMEVEEFLSQMKGRTDY
jgi:N-alpha-acetyltransferase 38, NatC auxiliary subunit